jgi:hypothetical protein
MSAVREPVPDLLHRFVETRHTLLVSGLKIETNDQELLTAIEEAQVSRNMVEWAQGYRFKLIREHADPSASHEVVRVDAGEVCTLTVGMTTIIMVDRDQRLVLSFIGGISLSDYFRIYLPLALQGGSTDKDIHKPHRAAAKNRFAIDPK